MDDIYDNLSEKTPPSVELKQRGDLKKIYYDFLQDFRQYLTEFVKESWVDLAVSNMEVTTTPTRIMDGGFGSFRMVFKNQGQVPCLLSTDRKGFFRLDPNEKIDLWLNTELLAVTVSGTTSLGFIRT